MVKTNLASNTFCCFEDWHPYLPEELQNVTEADWLQRSRQGNFPQYFRLVSERSPAQFRRSDIASWFKYRFSVLRPDCLDALLNSGLGFDAPPGPVEKRPDGFKNSKQKRAKRKQVPNA